MPDNQLWLVPVSKTDERVSKQTCSAKSNWLSILFGFTQYSVMDVSFKQNIKVPIASNVI